MTLASNPRTGFFGMLLNAMYWHGNYLPAGLATEIAVDFKLNGDAIATWLKTHSAYDVLDFAGSFYVKDPGGKWYKLEFKVPPADSPYLHTSLHPSPRCSQAGTKSLFDLFLEARLGSSRVPGCVRHAARRESREAPR